MRDVLWKSDFPQVYQKVRQLPLAKNLPPAQWMFLSLESGYITSEDYLLWAQNYYKLAILENSFFLGPFKDATFTKYKDLFAWGPQALPIFEWDGVVFVACIDPHSVPSNLEILCRPILATYEGLTRGWQIATSPDAQRIREDAALIDEASMISDIDFSTPDSHSIEQQDFPTSREGIESAPTPEVEAGNKSGTPSLKESGTPSPDVSNIEVQKLEHQSAPAPTEATLESPAVIPTSGNLFDLLDNDPSETLKQDEDLENADSNNEPAFEMPEGLNFDSPPAALEQAQEPPPISTASLQQNTSISQPASPPPATAPPAVKVNPSNANLMNQSELPKAPLTAPPKSPDTIVPPPPPPMELEEDLKLSFAKAYQNYRNLMILKVLNNSANPIRWDSSYKKAKSLKTIDLTQPSVFRIAAKTQKPFHGPISTNSVNSDFFENWFAGHVPKYLTVMPLFQNKELIGLLLGAADESLDRKDSLQLMEYTARNVEANFGAKIAA
jgi:hypothetical protein